MTSPWVRFAMVAPVFLFATVSLLLGLGALSPTILLVAVMVGLPILSVLSPRALGWLLAPSVVVFAFVGLLSWLAQNVPSGIAADVIVGALVALPLWFLGVCVGADQKAGIGLLALQAGLLEAVTLETALGSVPSGASPETFLTAWFSTVGHQLGALGSALTGNGLRGTEVIPLSSYTEPLFIVLALLALAGLLLPMIGDIEEQPPTLPSPSRRDLAESVRTLPPPVLYATAADATPAKAPLGAGFAPVAGTALAVLAFLAVASSAPSYAFLAVTLGILAAVLLLVRLASGPRPIRARRGRAKSSGP